MCKNVLLADLLGSQYLPEILQTSLTFKNSENMEKNDCFKKNGDHSIFFETKEGYKVSCVKLLMFWYIIRMSERAQIFFGNEGATSGALYKNNFVSDL